MSRQICKTFSYKLFIISVFCAFTYSGDAFVGMKRSGSQLYAIVISRILGVQRRGQDAVSYIPPQTEHGGV